MACRARNRQIGGPGQPIQRTRASRPSVYPSAGERTTGFQFKTIDA